MPPSSRTGLLASSPRSDREEPFWQVRAVVIAKLRRWLRPLKPVLGPIWRRSRAWRDARSQRSLEHEAARLEREAPAAAGGPGSPPELAIRSLRQSELLRLAAAVPYYRARLVYMRTAGDIADGLIARDGLTNALELGPHRKPLIVGADVMDLRLSPDLDTSGRRISHDATKAPWPIEDKAYGLFVALQVFEHLGSRQADAFREIRRVARHAILSLPIDWEMDDPTNCHHQLHHELVLAWVAPIVPTRVVVGNAGPRKRLIYVFEDLPALDLHPAEESPEPAVTQAVASGR